MHLKSFIAFLSFFQLSCILTFSQASKIQANKIYDVIYYDLNLIINPDEKYISGSNIISFNVLEEKINSIEIELDSSFIIDSIFSDQNHKLKFSKFQKDKLKIYFSNHLLPGSISKIKIYYSGRPIEATNPPWDGGFVWNKDSLGRHWCGVACEGIGAKSWWPCNDSWADEPDSMKMSFTVPESLSCIANGRMTKITKSKKGWHTFDWNVSYPINTYNVTFYLGHFAHFTDSLDSLSLDYYVLDYNLQKAKKHFTQTKDILSIFTTLFGTYPFCQDGYALIEAPYWGMEHQSAIAYGNNYINKILNFDFIILHETAHEWWGNSVTANDHGNMWIHEAFATYAEALFIEQKYSKEKALEYLKFQKTKILNQNPIQGPLGINYHDYTDTDMYYKGAWMLHTIREFINNDSLWFAMIKNFSIKYRYSIIDREDVINYFSLNSGLNLSSIFNEYLDYKEIPKLEYKLKKSKKQTEVLIRLLSNNPRLSLPIKYSYNGKIKETTVDNNWKEIIEKEAFKNFEILADNYLITLYPLN